MQQPQPVQPQPIQPIVPGTLPALAPVLDIPFPELGPGTSGRIDLRFDPTSTRLIVQHYERNERWPWLIDHRSDVSLIALVLGALASLGFVLRIARRPQRRLCHYCQRCNYELAGPSRTPLDPCPECGTSVSHRRPVAGKSRQVRFARVLLIFTILCAACLPLIARDVGRRSPGMTTWPIPGIDQYLTAWPLARVLGSVDLRNRVHVFALDANHPQTTRRLPLFTHEALIPLIFSPDGQTIAWIGRPEPHVPRIALYTRDLETGSTRSTPIPQTKYNAIGCIGLCGDGKTALLIDAAPKMKVIGDQVSRSEHESLLVDVYALSLVEGGITKIYSTTFAAHAAGTRSVAPGLLFSTGPGARWFLATTTQDGIRNVLVRHGDEVVPISIPPYNGVGSHFPAMMVNADTAWFGDGNSLSLAQASFSHNPTVDSLAIPGTNSLWFVVKRNGTPVAELTAAAGFGGGYMPVSSPDGRWIAMAFMPNALTPHGPFRIRLWDTSAVKNPASPSTIETQSPQH